MLQPEFSETEIKQQWQKASDFLQRKNYFDAYMSYGQKMMDELIAKNVLFGISYTSLSQLHAFLIKGMMLHLKALHPEKFNGYNENDTRQKIIQRYEKEGIRITKKERSRPYMCPKCNDEDFDYDVSTNSDDEEVYCGNCDWTAKWNGTEWVNKK